MQTRKSRDCPHTNAKCEPFSSVTRSDCGSDAKTGGTTNVMRDKNVKLRPHETPRRATMHGIEKNQKLRPHQSRAAAR